MRLAHRPLPCAEGLWVLYARASAAVRQPKLVPCSEVVRAAPVHGARHARRLSWAYEQMHQHVDHGPVPGHRHVRQAPLMASPCVPRRARPSVRGAAQRRAVSTAGITTYSTVTVERWEKAAQNTLQSHEHPFFQVPVTPGHNSTGSGSEPISHAGPRSHRHRYIWSHLDTRVLGGTFIRTRRPPAFTVRSVRPQGHGRFEPETRACLSDHESRTGLGLSGPSPAVLNRPATLVRFVSCAGE